MPKQYPATKRSHKFGPSEVLAAVESLYADKVQPIGRILLKRLGERAAPASQELDPASAPRIDPRYLRSVCERCDRLVVETMDSGEYSVLIAGRTATFVDASSENDPYPAKLWEELAAYFGGLQGDASNLKPNGWVTFALARWMRGINEAASWATVLSKWSSWKTTVRRPRRRAPRRKRKTRRP